MPASRFLIQTDEFEFEELVRTSTLLCFSSSKALGSEQTLKGRKRIPLTDPEVNITYHLISSAMLFRQIEYFQAIIETGNFYQAAEKCNVSQSAISQQIKKPRSKQACSGLFYTYLMLIIANAQLLDDRSNSS